MVYLLEPDGNRFEIWWFDLKNWFTQWRSPQENRLVGFIARTRSRRVYKQTLKKMEREHAWFNKRREPAFEQQRPEILRIIFERLSFMEKLNCRLVCAPFNDIIVNSLKLELGFWVRKHNRIPYTNCIMLSRGLSAPHMSHLCQSLPSKHLRNAHSHISAYQLTLESGACDKALLDTLEFGICKNIKLVNWKSAFTSGDNRKRFFETKVLQQSVASLQIAENSVCFLEELVGFLAGPNMLTSLRIDYGGIFRVQLPELIVEMFTLGEKLQEFRFNSKNNDFETTTGLVVQVLQVFFNQTTRMGEILLPPMDYRSFIHLKKYLNNQFDFGIAETNHKTFMVNLVNARSLIVTNDHQAFALSCLNMIG